MIFRLRYGNVKCALVSLLTLFVVLYSSISLSQARRYPLGCRSMGYEFKDSLLVLYATREEDPQTLFLLHNTSGDKIYLQVSKKPQDLFNPGYENFIKEGSWAVFAMDSSELSFECKSALGDEPQQLINCADVLELCQYNNVKFAEHNRGNYWVVNSAARSDAVRSAIKNGILLKS